MAADWCSMPNDVLGSIAIKLETIEDFIYFSSVCRSWNHASSCIKHLWKGASFPCLLLAENNNNNNDVKDNPDCIRKIFYLGNNKCYKLNFPKTTFGSRCWGSPYGWVAMVTSDLNVQLFNPITKANIQFPSCETLPNPLHHFEGIEYGYDYYRWFMQLFLWKLIVVKVCHNDGHTEFIIMALYDLDNTCKLAFARQGDQSWTPVLLKHRIPLTDLVTMDNYVYGLYDDGTIAYWNVKKFLVSEEPMKPMDFSVSVFQCFPRGKALQKTYLVQSGYSGSDLLLVIRDTKEVLKGKDVDSDIDYQTRGFKVHKFNLVDKKWEKTEDVGNVALFVGCNYSMSVTLTSTTCLKPNCIYFTDDESEQFDLKEGGGHDMGACNIKSGNIFRFYNGNDIRSTMFQPIWFTPIYTVENPKS